ncbi:DUF4232 domain-containing protein [Streptomyces sp. RLB1-33]|nr:DUF4232 domain-containing protein [Streptomyces sp. RLB1-33]QIY72975.1 DUF4232 domain-containing protein [Streptomyces sp. RLB1-33]
MPRRHRTRRHVRAGPDAHRLRERQRQRRLGRPVVRTDVLVLGHCDRRRPGRKRGCRQGRGQQHGQRQYGHQHRRHRRHRQQWGTGASRCHTAGLGFSFGAGDGKVSSSDDQQQLAVVLKNKTSAACTIQGFPGVDLKSSGGSWSLTRSGATPKKVTLAAGSSTTFTITFLPWNQGSGTEFKATSVVVTPPNETTSTTLAWPGGSVLLQDGATHPGTYTGPVGG